MNKKTIEIMLSGNEVGLDRLMEKCIVNKNWEIMRKVLHFTRDTYSKCEHYTVKMLEGIKNDRKYEFKAQYRGKE